MKFEDWVQRQEGHRRQAAEAVLKNNTEGLYDEQYGSAHNGYVFMHLDCWTSETLFRRYIYRPIEYENEMKIANDGVDYQVGLTQEWRFRNSANTLQLW